LGRALGREVWHDNLMKMEIQKFINKLFKRKKKKVQKQKKDQPILDVAGLPKVKKTSKLSIWFAQFKKFLLSKKEELKFIKELILFSMAYGLPINYMLWGVFNIPFSIWRFPAYGFLFYLIKMEFPDFFRKLIPERRN